MSKYLSLFRWAGAKKNLIPKIQTDSLGCYRYIEPFLGSAVVLLNLDNHITCIGGDENEELIETLKAVRDLPEAVIHELRGMENSKEAFLEIRQLDRSANFRELSSAFRAARFIYLNHTCFNGLYRVNQRGEFNVPFGHRKLELLEVEKRLQQAASLLQEKLEVAGQEYLFRLDYTALLADMREGDFYYLDPPYSEIQTQDMFVGYTAAGFSNQNHSGLLDWMSSARDIGVRVLLSNSAQPKLLELAHELDLTVDFQDVRRKIAASNESRGNSKELLIANY